MSWDLQDFEGYGVMSDLTKNFDSASALAARKGWTVCLPGPKELFVDIDDAAGLRRFKEGYAVLDEHGWTIDYKKTRSPSGEKFHWHIRVRLTQDVDPERRVLLQTLLGSDVKREALSFLRLDAGEEKVTIFFEKP